MKLVETTLNNIACIVGGTYRVVSTETPYRTVNALAVCINVNNDNTIATYIIIKNYGGSYAMGETFSLTIDNYDTYTTFAPVQQNEIRVWYNNLGIVEKDLKGRETK